VRDRAQTDLEFLIIERPASLGDLLQFGQNIASRWSVNLVSATSVDSQCRRCSRRASPQQHPPVDVQYAAATPDESESVMMRDAATD